MKTVAVIHTTPVTISGLKPLFEKQLSEVEMVNFLDETLLKEINKENKITDSVRYRFHTMVISAAMSKPDAILCACSSVGGLLEKARSLIDVPALRIDEPMTRQAVKQGTKIGVAATLNSTILPTLDLLNRQAEKVGKHIETQALVIIEAGPLLASGKTEEYNRLISQKLQILLDNNDLVLLAQASMAGALKLLDHWEQLPVLTSPQSGVAALKDII
jgi:Asp/Glu/hydantoin racemase